LPVTLATMGGDATSMRRQRPACGHGRDLRTERTSVLIVDAALQHFLDCPGFRARHMECV
jgi:hypothetical protein